jgi:DNA-binding beta-propeller fold protein YncE
VEQRATNGQSGHALPEAPLAGPRVARVLGGGATLARFDLPDRVRFFDLAALTLRADVDLGRDRAAKVAFPVALYTPDGATLYVANADAGTVRAVDLARGVLAGTVTVPAGTRPPDARPRRGAGPGTAALAPDGTRLYLIDGQAGSGLAVVQLPGLQPAGRWLAERTVHAVWAAPDGRTIFTLGPDGTVSLLRGDGSVVGALPLDTALFEFVTAV